MEIILAVHRDLELLLCKNLKQKLTHQHGLIGFVHVVEAANSEKFHRTLSMRDDCLIVAQVEEDLSGNAFSLDFLLELQSQQKNVFFLLLGKSDSDCRKAVQGHLHMIEYFNQEEDRLCDKIIDSIIRISQMEIPFCDGIFVCDNGEYTWISRSNICCIEKIKGTHYCEVKCINETYSLRENIKQFELCMGESFWKCRASTLINLKRIRKIDCQNRTILLDGGHICSYSKEYTAIVRKFIKNSVECSLT